MSDGFSRWTEDRDAEEAESVVAALTFLDASTVGDWDRAGGFVAPSARLVFPFGSFDSLGELERSAVGRYQWIRKSYLWVDVSQAPQETVVGIGGTLEGVNRYGVAFDAVRFFDRVVIERRSGLVIEQQVFNDLASSGVLEQRPASGAV